MEQVTVRTHQYTGAVVVQVKARLTLFDGHTLTVDDLEITVGTFGAETSVSITNQTVVREIDALTIYALLSSATDSFRCADASEADVESREAFDTLKSFQVVNLAVDVAVDALAEPKSLSLLAACQG